MLGFNFFGNFFICCRVVLENFFFVVRLFSEEDVNVVKYIDFNLEYLEIVVDW